MVVEVWGRGVKGDQGLQDFMETFRKLSKLINKDNKNKLHEDLRMTKICTKKNAHVSLRKTGNIMEQFTAKPELQSSHLMKRRFSNTTPSSPRSKKARTNKSELKVMLIGCHHD